MFAMHLGLKAELGGTSAAQVLVKRRRPAA